MSSPLARVLGDVHYAWYGPSMLITTLQGSCDESHRLTGYYYREARHLSVLKLELKAGGYDWNFIPVSGAGDSGSGTCH